MTGSNLYEPELPVYPGEMIARETKQRRKLKAPDWCLSFYLRLRPTVSASMLGGLDGDEPDTDEGDRARRVLTSDLVTNARRRWFPCGAGTSRAAADRRHANWTAGTVSPMALLGRLTEIHANRPRP
jgi:hypothetical protein